MKIFLFIVCFAIFLFGLWLMSIAEDVIGWQAPVFFGGIIAVAIAIAIPVHVIPKAD